MKTFKCQKWQSANCSRVQWAPAAFLQVSFWSEPLGIPGPGKAGWQWGHVTAFSLLQGWVLSSRTPPDPQCSAPEAPWASLMACPSFLGFCAVRVHFLLTHIPPTSHQKWQRGRKQESKSSFAVMVQKVSSFLASIKLSDMTVFLPRQNYCCFSVTTSRIFKKEKNLQFRSFDSSQRNCMFLQLFEQELPQRQFLMALGCLPICTIACICKALFSHMDSKFDWCFWARVCLWLTILVSNLKQSYIESK